MYKMLHLPKIILSVLLLIVPALAQNVDLDCPPVTLCYAIDESVSISKSQFTKQTKTLVAITNEFDSLSRNSTYAAVGFSTTASVIQQPTRNVPTFIEALQNNKQARKSTSLAAGLQLCDQIIDSAPHPRVIVLITDGKDVRRPFAVDIDDAIKDKGTVISTIGVGSEAVEKELMEIASSNDLYTSVENFTDLIRSINDIVKVLCKAIPSTTPTPSVTPTVASSSVSPSVSTVPSSSSSPSSSASSSGSSIPSTSVIPSSSATSSVTPTASSIPSLSVSPYSSYSSIPSASATSSSSPAASLSASPTSSTIPSVSVNPSTSSSGLASMTSTPTVSLSYIPSSSSAPSTTPVGNCATVECGKCGNSLECYVNSGSRSLDRKVFQVVRQKSRFCTWKRWLSDCGQQCRSVSRIRCYPSRSFPVSRIPVRSSGRVRFCRARKSRNVRHTMSSIATYSVCVEQNNVKITCMMRKCDNGSDNFRCDNPCY